jgi:hypothetical protein
VLVCIYHPNYVGGVKRKITVQVPAWAKIWNPIWNIIKAKRTGSMAQVIECLYIKYEVLSLNHSTAKKGKLLNALAFQHFSIFVFSYWGVIRFCRSHVALLFCFTCVCTFGLVCVRLVFIQYHSEEKSNNKINSLETNHVFKCSKR